MQAKGGVRIDETAIFDAAEGDFEQGRALCEKGGLNLEHLNETEQIEAEDD